MDEMERRVGEQFIGTVSGVSKVAPARPQPDGCRLAEMARWALNYLRGNPDPARRYECKFSLGPLGIPCHLPEIVRPNEYGYDPVSLGDTDARMAMQYEHMRRMAGIAGADEVEEGVLARVLGYLRDDGYAWINPAAYVGQRVEGLYIGSWTTAKCLYLLSEAYERTGSCRVRARARAVFEALRGLARWDGDRAWYMGIAPLRNGRWLMDGWCQAHGRNYPFVVEPLVRYWECTGDQEGLALACAFAEGFLAGSQPDMGTQRVDPQSGAFTGHVHLHTHAIWGVAHLGAILNEPRYLDWARRAYEFVRARGTDYGWYPEFIPQSEYRSETCVVGDMVSIAAWLARGGRPHYWDHVERTVRNYLRKSQFFLTPAFLELFHGLHKSRPPDTVESAMGELRRLEGGFVAQTLFDDWVTYPSVEVGRPGLGRNGIHMMGCCPPEGMRALYEAWRGVVEEGAEGELLVNISFSRDHPAALVRAFEPAAGRLDVRARRQGNFCVRPPAWAPRSEINAVRNGVPCDVQWGGPTRAYVLFPDVAAGEDLQVHWPVPAFTQAHCASSVPDRDTKVSVRWLGNAVRGVRPQGQHLPMFHDSARPQ